MKGLWCLRIFSMFTVTLSVLAPFPVSADPLPMAYNQRPPYHYSEKGSPVPKGIVADILVKALRGAGIEATFMEMEANRIISQIKGEAPFCSFSWFKNEERMQFAKFSHAITQDEPFVVVTKKENEKKFKQYRTIAEVFGDNTVLFGTGSQTSYGPYLDNLKQNAKLQVISSVNSQMNMIKMMDANRFHFMLLMPAEIQTLFNESQVDLGKYSALKFQDIPKGGKRRLMCSKSVPDRTVQLINRSLDTLVDPDLRGE